ncbi:hypothetical protein Zmor_020071 [Zophobas morio]|uniref:WD repeat-containing protein 89 n=1 Tax=Zophobas morio TaxID=2755281 RepID=A0AA38I744_9CUCU|nr:hypothetical protein Zmor_020071 [Zophobas morio]
MRELELENSEISAEETQSTSDDDGDTCDEDELSKIFKNCSPMAEKVVAPDKYILHIAATLETNPNAALSLSDNTCEVYNLSNNQFAKLHVFAEHTDVISEIRFSSENSNLLYTGCADGRVRLWDLRTPRECSVEFKDTTVGIGKFEEITCFDVSPNNMLLAAGTNLFEGDAFMLFWDVRKHSLLGGYWESHTDDITQVKFHHDDPNKLISGSVDGLINLYDLSQNNEEDALIDSLNTESSVEKLRWLQHQGKDIVGCITHTADVQLWRTDDAQPYCHLHRAEIAKATKRKSEEHIYVVDTYATTNNLLVLAGSNYCDGESFRGLSVAGKTVEPTFRFLNNKQRVRASWFNCHTDLLLSGGEKGIINAWKPS